MEQKIDHQYYNATISNLSYDKYTPDATYLANLNTPIIDKCSDYYCSIIRFTIPTGAIPILIYDSTNPYVVRMSYNGFTANQSLIYTGVISQSDPIYWYVYSYQRMLDFINQAFKTCYATLRAAAGNPPALPANTSPFLLLNTDNTISVICPQSYATNDVKIYINVFLNTFFQNLEISDITADYFVRLAVKNNGNNAITVTTPPLGIASVASFENRQPYQTLYNWNYIRSITFNSANIPINNEIVPNTPNVSNGNLPAGSDNFAATTNNFKPILTDFEVPLQSGSDDFSFLQYYPQGPWRMIDMTSDQPLKTLNFNIVWTDRFGISHYLAIPPRQSITVKFAFIRKTAGAAIKNIQSG